MAAKGKKKTKKQQPYNWMLAWQQHLQNDLENGKNDNTWD